MQVKDLGSLDADARLDTDLVIVGGGPAGLTIAREFFGTSTRVLILESGRLEENPRFANLNTVESIGEPKDEAQVRKRIAFHGAQSSSWSNESQRFGVRCRVLGGLPTCGQANQLRSMLLISPCEIGSHTRGGLLGLRL